MEEINWIGRTEGDHRVVCYETKKVYSCPDSAAYDTKIRTLEVEAVCNRYMKKGVNNMTYDWYAQYLLEKGHGAKIKPHPPKPYINIRTMKSHRKRLSKNGMSITDHRGKIPYFHRLICAVMKSQKTETLEMFAGDLLALMKEESEKQGIPLPTTTWAFSKHLNVHQIVYENILNMEIDTKYKPSCGRQTTWVKMTYKEGITKDDIYIYDDDESYLLRNRLKTANPVINMDSMRIYSSLRNAGRITKIDPKRINWCCLDDIEAIPYNGRLVKFCFGQYID